ncbi:MAG: patatin family protein [Oscillospiraceae bacterium]|nr:patatin family protein [Oscillospiraceae bacterium]
MKIGIVDVGGGTRGIYGAGVLDRCLDENIVFDYAVGVSAGSANFASYCAGQKGRNFIFYTEYSFRSEYMGFSNMRKTGSFIGLDYIYSELSNSTGENPLDYEAIIKSPTELEIVATNAETGKSVYFSKSDFKKDCYDILKASCCIPFVNRPYFINEIPYYDGGISDPVPFKRAFEQGCDKVVLILTKPINTEISNTRNSFAAKMLEKKYPEAAKSTDSCNAVYLESVSEAITLEKQGKVLIISPNSIGGLKTLSKDPSVLKQLYVKGYHDGRRIRDFIK